MKKILFCLFVAITARVSAQGVFLNSTDFISDSAIYDDADTKIRLNDFFSYSKHLTVLYNHKKIIFNRSDIFGYKDNMGHYYRFYNNIPYEIVKVDTTFEHSDCECSNLRVEKRVLYRMYSSNSLGKQRILYEDLYYSETLDGEIRRLPNKYLYSIKILKNDKHD